MPQDTVVASYSIVHYNYAVPSYSSAVGHVQQRDGPLGNSRKKSTRGGCMEFLRAGLLIEEIAIAIFRD